MTEDPIPQTMELEVSPLPGATLSFATYHFNGSYYVKAVNDTWIKINTQDLYIHLKRAGWDNKQVNLPGVTEKSLLTPREQAIYAIQMQATVDSVGPLAGFPTGLVEVEGKRHLTTSASKPLKATLGEWPNIKRFFDRFLDDEQRERFFAWLHVARANVLDPNTWRPGQLVIFVGGAGTGKNVCQERIISPLLGGQADPFQFISGATSFNADLIEAPHLCMSDPAIQPDAKSKRNFAANLKQLTVNHGQRLHSKGRNAVTVFPKWRVTLSCNMEGSEFAGLPNLDESMVDKIMLFKTEPGGVPSNGDYGPFASALKSELPAFAHFIDTYEIREEIRDRRFGVQHYQHPEMARLLNNHDPAERFWVMLQSELFHGGVKLEENQWYGSEYDLRVRLKDGLLNYDKFRNNEALLGEFLERLKKQRPKLLQSTGRGNNKKWTILKEEDE